MAENRPAARDAVTKPDKTDKKEGEQGGRYHETDVLRTSYGMDTD